MKLPRCQSQATSSQDSGAFAVLVRLRTRVRACVRAWVRVYACARMLLDVHVCKSSVSVHGLHGINLSHPTFIGVLR